MKVEESFGIMIPDGRVSQMGTVGELYAYILEETRDRIRDPNMCVHAATFYALRRCLEPHLDAAPSLRLECDVDAMLPRCRRQRLWDRLANEMDLRFPRLRRPSWVVFPGCIISVLACFATYFFAVAHGQSFALCLALIVLVSTAAIFNYITKPLAIMPADRFRTFQGLVNQLVALNYATLADRYRSWNPTDVWSVLQLIIVEQLGVKKEDVTPTARFVYDLGCD